MKILKSRSLYYDDVNLIAQPQSGIKSRSEIPKELNRIIVAPMQSIVGEAFAFEALDLGIQVCLPRFGKPKEQQDLFVKCSEKFGTNNIWYSIGLNDGRLDLALETGLYKKEKGINILIDVANGYLKSVADWAKFIHRKYPKIKLMVGNVHSYQGCFLYKDIPNIMIRIGLSNGSVCTTKDASGYNRGQITEIIECYKKKKKGVYKIIADGGISTSGCAAKAYACGADFIMIGGLLATAIEAQNYIDKTKLYYGGASDRQQIKQYGEKRRHSEGRTVKIMKHKPLKEIINEFYGGISSAISYAGFTNLTDFIGNGVIEIKK